MRKSIISIMMIVSLCFLLAGCFNVKSEPAVNSSNVNGSIGDESPADIFSSDSSQRGMGAFSFGPVTANDEQQVFEYSGEEIRIPFKVTGMDKDVSSDFGLLVFLDGVSQPYRMEESNGSSSKEQVMHKFYLKNEESKEFDIVFTPVIGQKGDKAGVVFATILQPDYEPEDESKTNYGIYHSLNATLPQEIYFKSDIASTSNLHSYSEAAVQDIPEEIRNQAETIITDGSSDYLDETTTIELLPEDTGSNVISAKNGKAKLEFHIYGGLETTYRTTIFVNHIPVQIMGSDFIETTLQKGKMNTVELELDTSAYGRLNTIYAVSVVSGKDYLTNSNSPLKTKSLLLVDES
ncbi:hypothetical protein [Paenibacillus lutimineralis]|uniref:Lipoprotein n=1 Tax=Paenibacillus lutimineralis TaxID=2707005 RepID=A0A3S9UZD1_9BACL|nr:hypothetical protein [Paenibacillus lutimineralis]AZS15685.1 hypothetical protein EI981_15370 [Paenibacillus lutimineralis]